MLELAFMAFLGGIMIAHKMDRYKPTGKED